MKNKKGQLSGAGNLAVGLILLTLIVAVGAIVISDIRTTEAARITVAGCDVGNVNNQSNCTAAVNISTNGLTGLSNMSAQFGTVGTIAIAAVLIALVIGAFVIRAR